MSVTIEASAVLLDMDGTLVDSTGTVEVVWRDWAATHGLDAEHILSRIHGRQAIDSMREFLPDRPLQEHLADCDRLADVEIARSDATVPINGADALLQALAPHRFALVTSAVAPLARARFVGAGLPYPPVAVTAESVEASKPDPAGFLLAAALLGVDPADCVVFEDSNAGVTAGKRAGMRVVGVGAEALEHGADWAVADLTDVTVAPQGAHIALTLNPLVGS